MLIVQTLPALCHTERLTTGKTAKEWKAFKIMQLIAKGYRYEYLIEPDGTIYRKSGTGIKPVEKRLGSRGFCEFKMIGQTVQYHQIVAKYLLPNPTNANMVFFRTKDYFNCSPENLRWVWSRQGRTLKPQEAIQRSKDRDLIAYYRTGNKDVLISILQRETAKISKELAGSVYLTAYNYAERGLLFDAQKDVKYLAYAAMKYSNKKRLHTVQINERYL